MTWDNCFPGMFRPVKKSVTPLSSHQPPRSENRWRAPPLGLCLANYQLTQPTPPQSPFSKSGEMIGRSWALWGNQGSVWGPFSMPVPNGVALKAQRLAKRPQLYSLIEYEVVRMRSTQDRLQGSRTGVSAANVCRNERDICVIFTQAGPCFRHVHYGGASDRNRPITFDRPLTGGQRHVRHVNEGLAICPGVPWNALLPAHLRGRLHGGGFSAGMLSGRHEWV